MTTFKFNILNDISRVPLMIDSSNGNYRSGIESSPRKSIKLYFIEENFIRQRN
jgi:hypothetical protein